jgi:uncharacterized damage-inducible protein DinB
MSRLAHCGLMAAYNQWMNTRLYDAVGHLTDAQLGADQGAFFGSVLGTLNHLLVGDTIWLRRFAHHLAADPGYQALTPLLKAPAPLALNQLLHTELAALRTHREQLDRLIVDWVAQINEADLDVPLRYANTQGVEAERSFFSLLMHFFNHQTHHRGQITTLLTQCGVDVGVTDLLALIPNSLAH